MSMVEIINGIQNTDPNVQFTCTQACRKLLSRERHPPIDDIIKAGVLPTLCKFLDFTDRSVLTSINEMLVLNNGADAALPIAVKC